MLSRYKNSLPPFHAVRSTTNRTWDFIVGFSIITFMILLAGIIIYSINELFIVAAENKKGISGIIILMIVVSVILALLIYKVIYKRNERFTTTIIDEKGIHYFNRFNNTVVNEILWDNFVKSDLGKKTGLSTAEFDIDCLSYDSRGRKSNGAGIIKYFWKVAVNEKEFIHTEFFSASYFLNSSYINRKDLIRAFLLGLAHYRPDLTINPWIFIANFIDRKDYTIYPNTTFWNIVFGFVFVVILIISAYLLYLVYHRLSIFTFPKRGF
ncbi:hypothetical protein [Flavobacterium aquidurense]|uniref:Uncharacterized protein n=1 Tax=Flavobacterium aquidurense TaxID=362413 RepID=A0A0Q0RXZ4_9FLAO|nr:hypothetical protein [Flavobacterium aquidurense]KQB42258.1 hypothetical protein RC62_3263 [Flavobacterium aquidurense]